MSWFISVIIGRFKESYALIRVQCHAHERVLERQSGETIRVEIKDIDNCGRDPDKLI
jgi:hypothetical protein